MLNKHLTQESLNMIVGIKAHFKKSLSRLLINSFPHYTAILTPDYSPELSLIDIN
jgi:hypothetical protein